MKILALPLAFALLSTGPVAALAVESVVGTTTVAAVPSALAPADRYFGRLQMSVLGIRNGVHDIALRIDLTAPAELDRLTNYFHKLVCVEDALLDLKAKFPNDSWIPPLGLDLAHAFMKLPLADAALHANDTLDWLVAEYPASTAAAAARDARAARLAAPAAADDVPIETLAAPRE